MENNSQAIEIKGIVRNQTKIGVQDGQCDDIVNLRFKDGSWRVADDGKYMYTMDREYRDLYVHTNSTYHHVLGVDPSDNTLYWFAEIDNDGETINPLDERVIVFNNVYGDVTIVQSGHLLSMVDIVNGESNGLRYSIYRSIDKTYAQVNNNVEPKTSRSIQPYGSVHFNLCAWMGSDSYISNEEGGYYANYLKALKRGQEYNEFSRPFLALLAVKLHDGSYLYASPPTLLFPAERFAKIKTAYDDATKTFVDLDTDSEIGGFYEGTLTEKYDYHPYAYIHTGGVIDPGEEFYEKNEFYATPYINQRRAFVLTKGDENHNKCTVRVTMSDLVLSLGDLGGILTDANLGGVFSGISVFVTREADLYSNFTNVEFKDDDGYTYRLGHPEVRKDKEIIHDLMHSPLYLLRDYTISELKELKDTSFRVDLSAPEYKGLLENLEQQPTLDFESLGNYTYCPKVIYSYNSRLHIANYKRKLYNGYPLDCFMLNNNQVYDPRIYKYWEPRDVYYKKVLHGVIESLEFPEVQYPKVTIPFINNVSEQVSDEYILKALELGTCFSSIKVTLETERGVGETVRHIQPYNAYTINTQGSAYDSPPFKQGDFPNFIESLSPLLSYPDSRATEMEIKCIFLHEDNVILRSKKFKLTPHIGANLSYYIDPELKPINLDVTKSMPLVDFLSANTEDVEDFKSYIDTIGEEDFPNGLKASEVNNPLFFPHEITYQIGNVEIVSMMSNAVAIGTGQTGDAPLYVFCKDGIYVLIVDPSGTMTYTNQPPIARDVCNNAKSVTPIDNGVVFTSDRGLMSIAGDKVIEIGSAAEGDVFDITDTSDKAKKIMFNAFAMQQLAEFPQTLVDKTDFLTYLKSAIVNYNHNERELMVSNPDKDYTYVMDRNGNWSRRAFTAQEYVNNYPTSYRIDKAGNFYKVDADDNDTNKVYLLSNVIKLGTIAFKQAYRLVVRGCFETENNANLGLYVFGSYDGRQWSLLGGNENGGKFTDIGCKISHTDIRFLRVCLAGKLTKDSRIDYIEVSTEGSALNGKLR